MKILRTPDERFADIADFPFEARYVDLDGLRMHYVDEGPPDAAPILLLHGEPTWAYLYRTMIPVLVAAGHRCVAPDLIGFGRSDKLARREDYTYARHLGWVRAFLEAVQLGEITLFGQDWGGLIGLRLATEDEDRFARIVAANTTLPTGDVHPGEGFEAWKKYSQESPHFRPGGIVKGGCRHEPSAEVQAAYDAPFPDVAFLAGAREFPTLVPVAPDDPESEPNRQAWKVLERWEKPFLCLFGEHDFVLGKADRRFIKKVPGAQGQPHRRLDAGHFIQEDAGEECAHIMVEWLKE